jgi:hypothetical protein
MRIVHTSDYRKTVLEGFLDVGFGVFLGAVVADACFLDDVGVGVFVGDTVGANVGFLDVGFGVLIGVAAGTNV